MTYANYEKKKGLFYICADKDKAIFLEKFCPRREGIIRLTLCEAPTLGTM